MKKKYTICSVTTIVICVIAIFLLVCLLPARCDSKALAEGYTEFEFDTPVSDISVTTETKNSWKSAPYFQAGYTSLKDYWDGLLAKRESAVGYYDSVVAVGYIISDENAVTLQDYEQQMATARTIDDYISAKEAADALVSTLVIYEEPVTTSSGYVSNIVYSSSASSFKQAGVLYDSQYEYSYYSSNVLYHYKTGEWTLGEDSIYRDSNGRVIVASDDYAQGTVLQSDIFGECIVADTGVGKSGRLDVYTAF